jgi:nucleotide-binding universal stress UspA family protein
VGKILCATRGGEGSYQTQESAIFLAKESGDKLFFFFVADASFLAQMAAPIVVDVERRLEDMGRFQLRRVQKRAVAQGIEAETIVRRGRFRSELVAAAQKLGVTLIVLGRPQGQASVFEEETLSAFADSLQAETGIEVRIL